MGQGLVSKSIKKVSVPIQRYNRKVGVKYYCNSYTMGTDPIDGTSTLVFQSCTKKVEHPFLTSFFTSMKAIIFTGPCL